MLPALPTGRTWMSGASPSMSTISKAAVFWPSIRTGLTELTSATGYFSDSSRASVEAVVEVPVHLEDLRTVHQRLAHLAQRDLALRHQHRADHARRAPRRRPPRPRCCPWRRR